MGKDARVIRLRPQQYKDAYTGVEVIKLTDSNHDTMHPYFTQPLFTRDGKALIVSSNRTGRWQLYLLRLDEPELIQLTDEPSGIHPHKSCMDSNRNIAYYWTGNELKYVDVESLEEGLIYGIPQGFSPSILTISSDGKYLAFAYSEIINTTQWQHRERFILNMYIRPRSIVTRVNVDRSEGEPLWGELEWITHVNISPVDPDIVLFNHEGPWYLVQRMHIVKASTHEVWPLYVQRRYVEMVGHEFFTRDGVVVAQYGRRSSPSSSDWVYYDLFINADGSNPRFYKYPGPKPGHIKTNSDARIAVGDKAYITPDFKDGDKYIALIHYDNDEMKAEVSLLCRHDSTWLSSQRSHPHPIFTPDDQYALFVSDKEGVSNIYLCNVRDKAKELGYL